MQLSKPTTVFRRFGGMGDILMLFGACKFISQFTNVVIHTIPLYEKLCRRCPYIADVIVGDYHGEVIDLGDTSHSFNQTLHQTDTYLADFDLDKLATAEDKEIVLFNTKAEIEKIATLECTRKKRFLLHPGLTDPARTWPYHYWEELAKLLMPYGDVIIIGSTKAEKTVLLDFIEGTWNLVNRLTFMETVALMKTSTILISADAGPIQLAGATDIGIVGFYTLIPGRNRLPYRHGKQGWNSIALEADCSFFPCFHKTHDKDFMKPVQEALDARQISYDVVLRNWCPKNEMYSCMRKITPLMVFNSCMELVKQNQQASPIGDLNV